MTNCKCGFTTDENKQCNGTHKIVKSVRDQIVKDIESIKIEDSVTNALGMKIEAIRVAKG